MKKQQLKWILENQRLLNDKLDLLLEAQGLNAKSIGGGGIKPPKEPVGG